MNNVIKTICIYCGSRTGHDENYAAQAKEFAKLMAEEQLNMVYGGGGVGLMGVMAKEAVRLGVHVTGIIPEFLRFTEQGMSGIDNSIITQTMHERKQKMAELADGFVIFPGGLGTLDEAFEIITWKQLKLHDKPIVLYNPDGYWDALIGLFNNIINQGFADQAHLNHIRIVDDLTQISPALSRRQPS